MKKFSQSTFSSLKVHNFRLYFIGQGISASGTWMQRVAQSWLVLQLTNSGTALGLASTLQFLPMLLLCPLGGTIADRFSKRNLLYITQLASGILAATLGLLIFTGEVQLWMVYVMALLLGLINTVDNPTRQTFISEMVGEEELKNAITLNSTLMNLSRVIGPTIAGIVIVTTGMASCFILNGFSFFAVIIVLHMMRSSELHKTRRPREMGGFFDGFYYILSKPILKTTLLMAAIVGTLSYEFPVSLALLAQKTFHGNAQSYAALTTAMGVGAIIGGLISAGNKKISPRMFVASAFLFGLSVLVVAVMPSLILGMAGLVVVGIFSIYFMTVGNTMMQLGSAPQLRGRVMAFWTMAFLGSTAIGGPIIGWAGQNIGPRWGLVIGGLAAIFTAGLGFVIFKKENLISNLLENETANRYAIDRDKT